MSELKQAYPLISTISLLSKIAIFLMVTVEPASLAKAVARLRVYTTCEISVKCPTTAVHWCTISQIKSQITFIYVQLQYSDWLHLSLNFSAPFSSSPVIYDEVTPFSTSSSALNVPFNEHTLPLERGDA